MLQIMAFDIDQFHIFSGKLILLLFLIEQIFQLLLLGRNGIALQSTKLYHQKQQTGNHGKNFPRSENLFCLHAKHMVYHIKLKHRINQPCCYQKQQEETRVNGYMLRFIDSLFHKMQYHIYGHCQQHYIKQNKCNPIVYVQKSL